MGVPRDGGRSSGVNGSVRTKKKLWKWTVVLGTDLMSLNYIYKMVKMLHFVVCILPQ